MQSKFKGQKAAANAPFGLSFSCFRAQNLTFGLAQFFYFSTFQPFLSLKFLPILLLFFATPAPGQTDTLRLIFAGDIMGHAPQIKSAQTGKNEYDYTPCFRFVKPLLERADLAIGNLELTLPGKPPYTGYPMFRSPDALAEALKISGFDVLVTANNHSNDARGTGVRETLDALRRLDFWQTGTFKNQQERDAMYPLMIYKNGFKLALLNCTYGTNGVPTEPPTIVNLIDTVELAQDLAVAEARQPDFTIVFIHWGLEYQLKENDEQRDIARFLIAHGADLVIGAHPHVVQPIKRESAQAPDGSVREAWVVYSLGNFISNQQQPHTDGGILFQADLVKKQDTRGAVLGDFGYLPVWRYIHKSGPKTTFFALPIARFERDPGVFPGMAATARAKMLAYAEALRKRLASCPEITF